jgi:hypothetical protein
MVVTRRWPRRIPDSAGSRPRCSTGWFPSETACGSAISAAARAFFRKAVADEVPLYGDQDIFFPLLARQNGFVVKEIDLPQSRRTPYRRHHGSGVYLRRLLDVLTVWFLAKFTRKPLRFFGLIGTGLRW